MCSGKVAVVASKWSPSVFSNASDSRGSELWEEAMESEGVDKGKAELMQDKKNKGEHTFTPRSPH